MDWDAFFTLHSDLPRQGPGERGDVSWMAEIAGLKRNAAICDAGCGPGADIPALLFAAPDAHVTAFDLHQGFVDEATPRFQANPQVKVRQGRLIKADDGLPDICALGPFDLIWCAGAAYFEGVQTCLEAWKPALNPGGLVAFSDAVWLVSEDQRSPDPVTQWQDYPAMTDLAGMADQIAAAGYETLGTRVLDDAAWEGYYGPMERRIAALRPDADAALSAVLDQGAEEARIWRQHRREFGYLLSVVRPL